MHIRVDPKIATEGNPIVELPPRHINQQEFDFAEPIEREIYDTVERKAQIKFCKFLREGTVLKVSETPAQIHAH